MLINIIKSNEIERFFNKFFYSFWIIGKNWIILDEIGLYFEIFFLGFGFSEI